MVEVEARNALPIDEIVQALKARAGFETLFATGRSRTDLTDLTSRLLGDYPDAYDVIAMGTLLEHNRNLKERALDVLLHRENGVPDAHKFEWDRVTKYTLLRSVEDLTVSMKGGKGRREGVEISKTAPLSENRSRWSWRRNPE